MAGLAALSIASAVVPLITPFLPSIVQLFQQAHPIPAGADEAVKKSTNDLKAEGANNTAAVLVTQLARAGSIPASADDPTVRALIAGAVESTYQSMKAQGLLGNSAPTTATTAPNQQTLPGAPVFIPQLQITPGTKVVFVGTVSPA